VKKKEKKKKKYLKKKEEKKGETANKESYLFKDEGDLPSFLNLVEGLIPLVHLVVLCGSSAHGLHPFLLALCFLKKLSTDKK
jgi:hypothetical protein